MLDVTKNTPPSALELKVGKAVRRRYCWALTFTAKQVSQSEVKVEFKSGIELNLVHPFDILVGSSKEGWWWRIRRVTYSITNNNIDPPKLRNSIIHHPFTIRLNTLIGLEGKGLDGVFLHKLLGECLGGFFGGLVVNCDIGAGGGELFADYGAEAAEKIRDLALILAIVWYERMNEC